MKYASQMAIAAVAGVLATGASAGEFGKTGPGVAEPVIAPAAQPAAPMAPFSWTGAYAGAGVGYGRMSFKASDEVFNNIFDGEDAFDSRSNALGALFAGYRMDMGNFVLGGEAIVSPATFGTARLPSPSNGDNGDNGNAEEIDYGVSLMVTAGMPVGPEGRTLGYVGIGPSLLRTKGDNGSENSWGGTAALGVDHMLTDNLMLRGSVNYTVINNVGVNDLNTRTLGAGVGVAFKF